MKARHLASALVISGACFACHAKNSADKKQESEPAAAVLVNQGVTVTLQSPAADALDYTFGSQTLTLQKIEDKGSSSLTSTRHIFIGSPAAFSELEKTTLTKFCQHIGISTRADAFVEATSLPADGVIFAQWRSHFSLAQKQQLSTTLESLQAPVRCFLRIQIGEESANQSAWIAFDPVPVETQKLSGTSRIAAAIEEGVMLIDENPTLSIDQGQLIPIDAAVDIKLQIAALNRSDFQVQLKASTGAVCRNTIFQDKIRVSNPTSIRSYEYELKGEKVFTVGSVVPQSLSGRTISSCGKVKTQIVDQNFMTDVACGDYRLIQDEGLEAGCQWSVEVVNPNDETNSITYTIGMEKITFESVDVTTLGAAASAIPEAPNNPVRAGSTLFTGFNPAQLSSMEQAFDFWIAVSPASYTKYFDRKVTRVSYLGQTGTICSIRGVLAYVTSLTSTEIFWCEAAGMNATAVLNQNTPLNVLLIGVTVFHEDLHTRGRQHDFDVPQYLPCTGTSEAALLAFDTLKSCTEDYCKAFKDYALFEYKAELDYSLQGDARRFQGQCQIWNSGLGLRPSDFRT